MAKRNPKRSAFVILRERERKRRLVPGVAIRRRIALAAQRSDPALDVLTRVKRLSGKHAGVLKSLVIRSMGLIETSDTIKRNFQRDGLDDISLDKNASALLHNAIKKVSEILIFKMVATELVNDPELRDRMVELFLNQRFEAMSIRPGPNPVAEARQMPTNSPTDDRRVEVLEEALRIAMGM